MSSRYELLHDFISNKMRMSHVYQPVMLLELLRHRGVASKTEIAQALLDRDVAQVEYYEEITRNMVGRVLTKNHGIADRDGDTYRLLGFSDLSVAEIANLEALCINKIEEYVARRGDRIWEHRRKPSDYVPGTLRYEVLKRARFRCELCGISAEEKALEVDHIVPRNVGGGNDMLNLQALCYSCNATKRDRDSTDFRDVPASYRQRMGGCAFCDMPSARIVAENELCYAVRDLYPVTPQHTLVIPKRHVADYFDLYQPERNAAQALLEAERESIKSTDTEVSAFNVGINCGEDAGQTIFHCHIHLIPRRKGDIDNPRGGVRGVIPSKRVY
jgi:diadenosine tetraphosphate (Ap4A) HIT family hydrolase/5-methylcytosine-specific restriction endonuclease McrA